MKKLTKGIWKKAQWIIAVTLGIAALGAFKDSFVAGLCWSVSALLICPASRNTLVNIITKKTGVQIKDNLLKKNKGSVNSILCGVVAVVFLCIGSEILPEPEVTNSNHIAESTVESGSKVAEVRNEVMGDTKENAAVEDSEMVFEESISKEEDSKGSSKGTSKNDEATESGIDGDSVAVESSKTENFEEQETVESVIASSEESSEPILSEPIVSDMEVHFIDVGEADAALVLCGSGAMLIDGGNVGDSSLIYAYLKSHDISYLDYIVATHAHEDHVGGLAGALNYADVGTVYCPVTTYDSDAFSDFKKYVEKNNAQITVPSVGDSFALGNAIVEILGLNAGSEDNDTSIILKITHGEISFLFTGDAEREAEQAVLNSGCDLSSTVLKVGHHGSADSSTYPFLREIMPAYAVISVGENNSYGHPTEEVLSRLRDADVKVFRTDLQGDIIAVSDTKNITISVEKNADADTLAPQVIIKPEPTLKPTPEPTPKASASDSETSVTQPGKTYVLNTNTKKFHIPSCSSVKTIKDTNYAEYTGTAAEVEAMGYVGCKKCNPR